MKPSVILDTGIRTVFHTILLFSVFLLFAGHNAPGGGFVGGLVAGGAFVLRYIGGGSDELVRLVRVDPAALLGGGVVLAAAVGVAPWFFGGEFLESGKADLDVPVLGVAHVGTSLVFDVGVYLVVVGLTLTILRSLGREAEE